MVRSKMKKNNKKKNPDEMGTKATPVALSKSTAERMDELYREGARAMRDAEW